jgi:hypothetical protein
MTRSSSHHCRMLPDFLGAFTERSERLFNRAGLIDPGLRDHSLNGLDKF